MEQQQEKRDEDRPRRRVSDQPEYIRKVGGISILSVAAAITAIAVIGNLFWQSKDKAVEDKQQIETRITATEKDMVEIKTDLKYIVQSVNEIKAKVK